MNPTRLLLTLAVAMLLTVSATLLAWTLVTAPPSPMETARVPYLFYVNETSGIDLGTDIFRLGAVMPGNGASRKLMVAHASAASAVVGFRGEGAEYLLAEPRIVGLENGTVNVTIRVRPPLDAPLGRYEGHILLAFYEEGGVTN